MTSRTLLVVMGVTSTGKSTVAAGLAKTLDVPWIDADDLHSEHAVQLMRSGVPLTDDDRWGWLARIGARLADTQHAPKGVVVACSALRRAYRDCLRASAPGLKFVFLHGSPALIEQRMLARVGHYMPVALLASQLQTLEAPDASESDVVHLDIDRDADALVSQAIRALASEAACATTSTQQDL